MSREQARPSRAEQGPFHYRRWRVGLLLAMQLAVLLALAGTQVKARARFRAEVVKRISLAQHLTPPTFLEARRLTLMDRGQLLYLGQGTKQETGQFQLLRLADLQLIKQRAPLADSPGNEASARVLDLLFYDSELGQAGFHVRLRGADGFEQRYLHWDLKQNRITRVERYVNSFSSMRPIGFSPRRGLLYCQVVRQPARKGQRQPLEVIALGPKPARRIV